MTIEIRELVIRAVVDARGSGPPPTEHPPRTPPAATTAAANPDPVRAPEDREALVARCVREVLRELRRARER